MFQLCGDAGGVKDAGLIQVDKNHKQTVIGKYTATEAKGGSKKYEKKISFRAVYISLVTVFYSDSYVSELQHISRQTISTISLKLTKCVLSGDWVMLTYEKGDNYTRHCNKEMRNANIMISCVRNIKAVNEMHIAPS